MNKKTGTDYYTKKTYYDKVSFELDTLNQNLYIAFQERNDKEYNRLIRYKKGLEILVNRTKKEVTDLYNAMWTSNVIK